MGEYSNYSFNKSHSLCYAINGFIAMYLKVYFPLEYYSVLFQYSSNSELGFYIKEAKQKGVLIGEYKLGEVSREFEEDM
jgi:DNA polymerase-3 subunit alpha